MCQRISTSYKLNREPNDLFICWQIEDATDLAILSIFIFVLNKLQRFIKITHPFEFPMNFAYDIKKYWNVILEIIEDL